MPKNMLTGGIVRIKAKIVLPQIVFTIVSGVISVLSFGSLIINGFTLYGPYIIADYFSTTVSIWRLVFYIVIMNSHNLLESHLMISTKSEETVFLKGDIMVF